MAADIHENANTGLSGLSEGPAGLIRKELEPLLADIVERGRQAGVAAGILGGAGVLGAGAFATLTSALIAALERRPARGALIMAAIYGVGSGVLTEAGVNRFKQTLQAPGDTPVATDEARPAKRAKSSAKAIKRTSPTKAAAAGKSSAQAAKRKSSATATRSA